MSEHTKEDIDYRTKRKKLIKKIIIGICVFFAIFPLILSIFLLCRVVQLEHKIDTVISENGLQTVGEEANTDVVNAKEKPVSEPAVDPQVQKKVYLTFDDGPSKQTKKVLDVLKEKNVKATFFCIGREEDYSKSIYKRIVEEGHTLGMHSYSHMYKEIYGSFEGFQKDFNQISECLTKITGMKPVFYRFPGGSSNTVHQFPIEQYTSFLQQQGVTYMDWNVIAANGTTDHVTKDEMVKSIMDGVAKFDTSIVLMYDSADKKMTAKSLGDIIDNLKAAGYELLPIDSNTTPIHHS